MCTVITIVNHCTIAFSMFYVLFLPRFQQVPDPHITGRPLSNPMGRPQTYPGHAPFLHQRHLRRHAGHVFVPSLLPLVLGVVPMGGVAPVRTIPVRCRRHLVVPRGAFRFHSHHCHGVQTFFMKILFLATAIDKGGSRHRLVGSFSFVTVASKDTSVRRQPQHNLRRRHSVDRDRSVQRSIESWAV